MSNTGHFYNKYFVTFLHIGVWGMLFISPYLFISGQTRLLDITKHSWIPLLFYIIIFYLNYFFLIKRFIFTQRIFLFILVNLLLIFFFVWIKQEYIFKLLGVTKPPFPKNDTRPSRSFFIYIDSLSLIIPVVFAIALRVGERWLKTEAEKKEIQNVQLQTELQHLKYQIQPHFFFNSLNNIYSLVDISPDKAKETIHSLSKLMRYLLYDSNTEQVSLSKEIDFMNKYIELMRLRLSDKTSISVSFPLVNNSVLISPLLFISIIENAFKHGVSATQNSEILFSMTVEDQKIHFLSINKNYPKNYTDKSGSGIGVPNLQKRLKLLYPNHHSYKSEIKDENYIVNLTILLN